ncbi:MAG: addiction module protein [Candidatus Paceibacterota bacterium]
MKSPVAIDQLSLSEKIELMEKLWADITASADYVSFPKIRPV